MMNNFQSIINMYTSDDVYVCVKLLDCCANILIKITIFITTLSIELSFKIHALTKH